MKYKFRKGVMALIVKDKKILMGKKCNRPGHLLSNSWHFPGGKVEDNENLENAIIREMYEELGMNIKIIKKLCVYKIKFKNTISQNTVFICESDDEPVANDDLVDANYFEYKDIIKLHHKVSFEDLPEEVKNYLEDFKL